MKDVFVRVVRAAVIAASACLFVGGIATGAADTGRVQVAKASSPAGLWEMRYKDAVGQSYLDVLELRPDGTYATHMQGATPSDLGQYKIQGDRIGFRSAVSPRLSRDMRYAMPNANTLRLTLNTPQPVLAEWKRSALKPVFTSIDIDGRQVPTNLPHLVVAAMEGRVLPWRPDALPISVEVKENALSRPEITLDFYSPSSGEVMRLLVSTYDVKGRVIDGARLSHLPLPVRFVDLAGILAAAKRDGVAGALNQAQMKTYSKAGPAWMLSLTGPAGATYSAESGTRIRGDVTGYVAQYEADWKHAGDLWRKAMERNAPKSGTYDKNAWRCKSCSHNTTPASCAGNGGSWDKDFGTCRSH
jgi:hypothetical protein